MADWTPSGLDELEASIEGLRIVVGDLRRTALAHRHALTPKRRASAIGRKGRQATPVNFKRR